MTIELKTHNIRPMRHTFAHVARQIGGDKPASRYQEATLETQPTGPFHYRPIWDPDHEIFDATRTAVKMKNWYAFKDPRQYYYGNWTMNRARQQETMEANFDFVESRGMVSQLPGATSAAALSILMPLRHVAWGANMNNSSICAYGYGTAITAPAMFCAMDQLGIAQYLTRIGLLLDDPEGLDQGKRDWLEAARWQELRRYVEDTFVVQDWFELFVAQNLALDGILYPLVYRAIVNEHLAAKNGTAIAMLTAFMTDWFAEQGKWVDAQVKTAAAESDENRALLADWTRAWSGRAIAALRPVVLHLFDDAAHADVLMDEVADQFSARAAKLGLTR
ncbi:aromatic/alkene monooxygenase hydroxylase subunit beta [Massilia niastensis]|uniref:aromatic/alkene monooxygenase hydroxylase subunit beta n=1 Tax=Massilia niastensis TaxID=544911 RepID=UPI0003717A04|nr:aromatic/alkene monooxygenase hydroxylase subunit beta [Massilia niastensis]